MYEKIWYTTSVAHMWIHLILGSASPRKVNLPKTLNESKVTEGHQTLRARCCPTSTDNEEYDHRVKEGKKLHQRMLKAPLNKESTVIGFQSIAHQKMENILPIPCFNDK
jgi:hypothetical protein